MTILVLKHFLVGWFSRFVFWHSFQKSDLIPLCVFLSGSNLTIWHSYSNPLSTQYIHSWGSDFAPAGNQISWSISLNLAPSVILSPINTYIVGKVILRSISLRFASTLIPYMHNPTFGILPAHYMSSVELDVSNLGREPPLNIDFIVVVMQGTLFWKFAEKKHHIRAHKE